MKVASKLAHYASRRFRHLLWTLLTIFDNTYLDPDADIALSAQIRAREGLIVLGRYVLIDKGVIMRAHGGKISVGSHSTIGPYSTLYGGGDLSIGSGVRIGPHVSIAAANHCFNRLGLPIYLQGMSCKGIFIDDDVWIGAGAIILDGVSIMSGSVIGAGAVVTKDIASNSVVAGVPARLISTR